MRNLTGIIILLLIGKLVEAHPLHISITNIEIEKDSLIITIQTFKDDWETAYFHYNGQHQKLETSHFSNKSWYRSYFESSFKFSSSQKGKPWKKEIKQVEITDQSMMIEFSIGIINNPNSLYIYNSILTDIFGDQNNLFIISFKNKEKGIKFDALHKEEYLKLK